MKNRSSSTHRTDTPDRHNGKQTNKQADVSLCKFVFVLDDVWHTLSTESGGVDDDFLCAHVTCTFLAFCFRTVLADVSVWPRDISQTRIYMLLFILFLI